MLNLREFSAWIVSEGEPLREYLITVDPNASKISCWVPCEVGKSFSVHWRDAGTGAHSCAYISLDGFQVPGRFLSGYGEASREGVRTSANTERPFVFVGQSSASAVGGLTNPDAGTIVLKIRLVTIEGTRSPNNIQILPTSQSNTLSHCISFGEEKRAFQQYPQTWNVKDDGSGNRSYVTFVFRYRSREFLVSQGIMTMNDALPIPPAAGQTPALTHPAASNPQAGNSMLLTPSPTPSPQTERDPRQMGAGLQSAFGPESVPVQPVRTASMNATRSSGRFPGEGMIDFSPNTEEDIFQLEKWVQEQ